MSSRSGVHPRVGGGAGPYLYRADFSDGPSPRGRGSHTLAQQTCFVPRSIPAWAGEPVTLTRMVVLAKVHPRVGGGASKG